MAFSRLEDTPCSSAHSLKSRQTSKICKAHDAKTELKLPNVQFHVGGTAK